MIDGTHPPSCDWWNDPGDTQGKIPGFSGAHLQSKTPSRTQILVSPRGFPSPCAAISKKLCDLRTF